MTSLVSIYKSPKRAEMYLYLYNSASVEKTVPEALLRAFGKPKHVFDLLLTPSLPLVAFEAGAEWPEGHGQDRWSDWTPFTYPFNLTRQPAAAEDVLHDLGAISIFAADTQGMGRVHETITNCWRLAAFIISSI